jgi:hypothetical protein
MLATLISHLTVLQIAHPTRIKLIFAQGPFKVLLRLAVVIFSLTRHLQLSMDRLIVDVELVLDFRTARGIGLASGAAG